MSDTLTDPGNYGTAPRIDAGTEVTDETKYAVNSPAQAFSVAWRLLEDWKRGITNAAAITAQLNGQRPRDPAVLNQLGRNWLPNINSGILRVEAGKVPARLWMPIATATYLTAAKLPSNWPQGDRKTSFFRQKVTEAIRSWSLWPWFMRQLTREVGYFGFGFSVWFDEDDWRPTFVRQDRAFVPIGWEVLSGDLPLFMVKYDYQPHELIKHLQEQEDAQVEDGWRRDAVVAAINRAAPKPRDASQYNARTYEEMIRDATVGWNYEKGFFVIPTYHLFSTDADGTVSHHVIESSQANTFNGGQNSQTNTEDGDPDYLYEQRGQFTKMSKVVTPLMFDPDNGTIHGSWGAGQMLFDLSIETEKAVNDWMSSLKQAAKLKIQAGAGKNPDEVKLHVDDTMMVVVNGVYAGNTAAVTTDPKPFQAVIEALGQLAREKIGSHIPPIALQPNDIKAAQINAKQQEQKEVQQQIFTTFLWQFSYLVKNIVERLVTADSTDDTGKKLRKELLNIMTPEELDMLVNQTQIETIFEFTDMARASRAQFAASKAGNPFYNQKRLEEIQSEAAGGPAFSESILIPGDDATTERAARRRQMEETATMMVMTTVVDVLPDDMDWFHMLELRPKLEETLQAGDLETSFNLLSHYKVHYVGAVAKQGMPKDKINVEKAFIAKAGKTIETGVIPPEGYQDQVDPIDEAQAQMARDPVINDSPNQREVLPEIGTSQEGLNALVEGSA